MNGPRAAGETGFGRTLSTAIAAVERVGISRVIDAAGNCVVRFLESTNESLKLSISGFSGRR